MADLSLATILSGKEAIPEKWRIAEPIDQRHYLCDGSLAEWIGPRRDASTGS